MDTLYGVTLHTAGKVIGCVGSVSSVLGIVIVCMVHSKSTPVFGLTLGYTILFLLSSVLLVVGTMKNRHLWLLPWLVTTGLSLLFVMRFKKDIFCHMLSERHAPVPTMSVIGASLITLLLCYGFRGILLLFVHIKNIRNQEQLKIKQN